MDSSSKETRPSGEEIRIREVVLSIEEQGKLEPVSIFGEPIVSDKFHVASVNPKSSKPQKIWIDENNFYYEMHFQDTPELSISTKLAFAAMGMHDKHAIVDGFRFMRSKSFGMRTRTIQLYFTRAPKELNQ